MPGRARRQVGGKGRLLAPLCAAAGAGLILATASLAQQSQLSNEAAQKLKQNREKLEQTERRATELSADVAQLDQERARLNAQLQEAARNVQFYEARLSSVEARRDGLEAQQKLVQGSLEQRRSTIASLLSAMQRMGRNPPPVIITRREDALEMVRSAMLLARAVPELQSQVGDLVSQLGELDGILKKMAEERERIETETHRLKDAQKRLAMLMETKRQSQSERQAELDEVRRQADAISSKVKDIGELIAALDQTVAKKIGLATYDEAEAQRQAAADIQARDLQGAPLQGPQKQPPARSPQAADKGQQVAILLTPGAGAKAGAQGPMKPTVPFHLARGQLPSPAAGQRILSFGDTTSTGRKSQGLVIETRHAAQITSPCDGWVVFAGEFRSYRQLLIINAGGGYHILLAGLSQIDAQLGQFVLAGEPVGTMSTPKGKTQENAPLLYVEFRKEGRPIDPAPWWNEGQQQKVQG